MNNRNRPSDDDDCLMPSLYMTFVPRLDRSQFYSFLFGFALVFFVSVFLFFFSSFLCDENDDDHNHICSRIIRTWK